MIGGRRLAINLVAFVVLAAVVLVWGAVQLLDTQAPSGPRLTVVLDATGGVGDRTDVTYLGQTVGRVADVAVVDDAVEVEVRLEVGAALPAELDARVRRRSAVGEPYLDLRPSAAVAAAPGTVRDGTTIPRERTTLPLSYAELFEGVSALFDAVDPEELGILIDEFALVVEGRGPVIRALLEDGASVATTLGDGAEVIDEAVTEVGQLTALLADRSDALSGSIDDLRTIGDGIAGLSDAFEQAVDRDPTFVARAADLLEEAGGSLSCTVNSLAAVVGAIDDGTLATLDGVLEDSEMMRGLLAATQTHREDGIWLATELMLSTEPIEQRTPTGELPTPPQVGDCPAGPAATPVAEDGPAPGPGRDGPDPTAGAGGSRSGDGRDADDGATPRASSDVDTSGDGLPVGLAVIGLLVIAATAATRPWRWLRGDGPRSGT